MQPNNQSPSSPKVLAPNKSRIIKAFNIHFAEFIASILAIFPENVNLQIAQTSFDAIKRANPTIIAKIWKSHIYLPYQSVVESGDIEFIATKNFESDMSVFQNAREILRIIDTLRLPILTMSESDKKNTMTYIQTLSKLSVLL